MKKKNNILKQRIILIVLGIYIFIALFANILSNEKPLFLSSYGKIFFPAFNNNPYIDLPDSSGLARKVLTNTIDWKNFKTEIIIFPPVCWSPVNSDLLNCYASPFSEQQFLRDGKITSLPLRFHHFLGTGKTGNDVLAGLIYGTRTSITIGVFSIALAILIGIFLGGLAGYFGDYTLKIRRGSLFLFILMIFPAWFYSYYLHEEILKASFSLSMFKGIMHWIFYSIIFISILAWPFLLRFGLVKFLNKKITFPIDSAISRTIEIFLAIPRLILILTIAAIVHPSVFSIILIIGLTSWSEIARLMRAQVLQLRELNYIAVAKTMGLTSFKIIRHHLLPNAISQIIILGTFGIASAILTETGLSFLGIGVPAGTATWGSLMFEARENFQAWWLVVFTGLAIFSLLSVLFILGNTYKKSIGKIAVLP